MRDMPSTDSNPIYRANHRLVEKPHHYTSPTCLLQDAEIYKIIILLNGIIYFPDYDSHTCGDDKKF